MKQIKTLLSICILSLFSIVPLFAQDLNAATDQFNNGANALKENNYVLALESFNKTIEIAKNLGEEGATLLADSKAIVPKIHMKYGKELASARKIDEALVQLTKAAETAKTFGAPDIEKEANELIPQIIISDATSLINEGKFQDAILELKKVLTYQPNNNKVYIYIGMAESGLNNEAGAVAAYEKAIQLGDNDESPKRLSTLFLKKSAAATKTKVWLEVYENAKKAQQYFSSGQGSKLLGLSAIQLKKYDEAIAAIDSYLSSDPQAKDKNNMFYNLGLCYEAKKNPAKACGYYKQIITDPVYKAFAEQKVKIELKCK